MSSESPDVALGPPRRLHPAGIAVLALGALRGAALPLLAVFLAGLAGRGLDTHALVRALALAGIATAAATAAGVVAWYTTTWQIGTGTLRHRRGVLSVKETDVPLGRVQAVDTVRGPVQRLFGVVGVHVQTAGGGREAEIVLPALSAGDVAALRDAVGARRPAARAPEAPAAPPEPVRRRRLGRRQLLVAALTAGRLGVLLPVVAALAQLLDDVFQGDEVRDAGRLGATLTPDTAGEWVLLGSGVLLAAWLISMAAVVVTFAGFTVARDGDRLHISRGLIARREASVPVARVQAVRVVEGVLRQPWGLALLRIEVAGYKAEAPAAQTLFPLLRRTEVRGLLDELLPELADAPDRLARVPRRAARRYALPPALAGLAAGAAAALLVPGAGPWPLLLALAGAGHGLLRWRAAGWRLEDGRLAVRWRRLARTTVLAPAGRLQEHALSQTILQRRARLADVEVRIGAGTRGRVHHLELPTAARLFAALRLRRDPRPT